MAYLALPLSFPLFYVREPPVSTLFGAFLAIYWSCKLAQVGEGKPTSFVGLAPSPDRAELHAYSAVSLSSGTLLPFICIQRTYQQFSSMGGRFGKRSSP